ncbi:MAG: FAD-binding protein [Rhizobiaceae bacterium]
MDHDVDFLIVGAGACGLAAAIAAHDAGLSVAILEKMPRPGGNLALSTGSIAGAGTRFQREARIEDSGSRFCSDLMRIAPDTDDADLVRRVTEISAETVEWLVDTVKARLHLVTTYKHIGHTQARLHAPASRRGIDLLNDLLVSIDARGIPVAVGNEVLDLIADGGAIVGARTRVGRETATVRARKLLLAVSGFGANRDLVRRFCPEIAEATYFGAQGSTGEAVIWGEKLGAELLNMGAYQAFAAVSDPHGSLLSWTTVEKGAFMVAPDGRRFGDESLGYSGFARLMLAKTRWAYAVFDQRIFDIVALEDEFAELSRLGGFKSAGDPRSLAAQMGLDAQAFSETFAEYHAAATGTRPDVHGRQDFGLAPLEGRLFACRVVAGLFNTQGGLRIDRDARVLRPDGAPIRNLFAGGGAAAGISGRQGPLGYASGCGLLSAIALGRVAALAAEREVRPGRER